MNYIREDQRIVKMYNVNPSKYQTIFEQEEKKAAKKEENGRRN